MADGTQTKEVATVEQSPRANGLQSVRVVHDPVAVFDTGKFEHMQRLAHVLANSSLVPDHLKGDGGAEALANCFLVVNQAHRWNMDPFAVAQATFVTRGKIGYEGKLVAAALAELLRIKLAVTFAGKEGTPQRSITLTDDSGRSITGAVEQWQTRDKEGKIQRAWQVQPDDQLIYRGTRQWCRRYEPGVILGVYTPDELEDAALNARDITPKATAIAAPKGPPPAPRKAAKQPGERDLAADDPVAYLVLLEEEFIVAADAESIDQVWAAHLRNADGKLPRKQQEEATALFETHAKRFANAEPETMQLPM
jgi:RecT family